MNAFAPSRVYRQIIAVEVLYVQDPASADPVEGLDIEAEIRNCVVGASTGDVCATPGAVDLGPIVQLKPTT